MAQVGVGYRRANAQDAPGQGPVSTPEQQARAEIDRLLQAAGWAVQSVDAVNLHAARGVAIREFPLEPGFGFADYLLYVAGKACGVVEAKKRGATLTGVEIQSGRYAQGLPASLPAWQSARWPSSTNPPAPKPISPKASTRRRAPATCLPSTGPHCWPSG